MEIFFRVQPGRLVSALVCGMCVFGTIVQAQELPAPSYPVEAYKKNDKGIVVVHAEFDAEGKVGKAIVVRSNAPFALEASTVDHIQRKWIYEEFANQALDIPVTYDELPWYATHWNDRMAPPSNILPQGDPGRTLKLRLTFGKDGWIEHVQVLEPSGIELVDRETAIWVKVHWHNEAFAGQTVDSPFIFKTPPLPKPIPPTTPVAVKTKPKPKPEPTPTPEPAAAPAVRVE